MALSTHPLQKSFVKKIGNERTERKADFTGDLSKNGTLLLITENSLLRLTKKEGRRLHMDCCTVGTKYLKTGRGVSLAVTRL